MGVVNCCYILWIPRNQFGQNLSVSLGIRTLWRPCNLQSLMDLELRHGSLVRRAYGLVVFLQVIVNKKSQTHGLWWYMISMMYMAMGTHGIDNDG